MCGSEIPQKRSQVHYKSGSCVVPCHSNSNMQVFKFKFIRLQRISFVPTGRLFTMNRISNCILYRDAINVSNNHLNDIKFYFSVIILYLTFSLICQSGQLILNLMGYSSFIEIENFQKTWYINKNLIAGKFSIRNNFIMKSMKIRKQK